MEEATRQFWQELDPRSRRLFKELARESEPGETLQAAVQRGRLKILKKLTQLREEVGDSLLDVEIYLLELKADEIKVQLQREYRVITDEQLKKLLEVGKVLHGRQTSKYKELVQLKKLIEERIVILAQSLDKNEN